MPLIELSREEIEAFLASRRVARVCFHAGDERHLVPLGYAWHDAALCGSMTVGRKTRLADADPRVAFQVDDTDDAGLWEWTSVSGEGVVEWVEDPEGVEAIAALQAGRWSEIPDWLREELEAEAAAGRVRWFRVRPTRMTGVASRPADTCGAPPP